MMSSTILPHPPAIIRSSLKSPCFWWTNGFKILVAMDEQEHEEEHNHELNPRQHREMISNNEDNITIFGSHTILVHSIMMLLIYPTVVIKMCDGFSTLHSYVFSGSHHISWGVCFFPSCTLYQFGIRGGGGLYNWRGETC